MIFLPWRNELTDLYGGQKSYNEHYNSKKEMIKSTHLKYEKYNEALEDAIEEINQENQDEEDTEGDSDIMTDNRHHVDEFGFFILIDVMIIQYMILGLTWVTMMMNIMIIQFMK